MWKSYFQLALAMIFAGSTIVAAKQLTSIPPILVSGLSFITALIPFVIFTITKEGFKKLDKGNFISIFLQALFGAFCVRFLINFGVKFTSALEAGIILSIVPAVTLILARIILKEKISLKQTIGIAFVLIGLIFINLKGKGSNQQIGNITGNLLLLAGVFCNSIFTILSKKVSKEISIYTHTMYVLIFATILYIPFIIVEMFKYNLSNITTGQWIYIIYYGVIATAFAYFLWFGGLTKVKANLAGVFTGIMPISSTILSVLLLNDRLTFQLVTGLLITLVGILITTLKPVQNISNKK